jgi:hypothetical protein
MTRRQKSYETIHEYTEEDIESLADRCDHVCRNFQALRHPMHLLEGSKETIKKDDTALSLST